MPSPAYDARALAAHLLGVRASGVLAADDLPEAEYRALVVRRAERVPLQHLVGSVGFRYLDLLVGPGVFIPRPETELVAQAVIDELTSSPRPSPVDGRIAKGQVTGEGTRTAPRGAAFASGGPPPLVVDLCSGSGAIALSVAHEVPGAVVHAVELDPVALGWARRNDPMGTVTWHLGPVAGCLPDLDSRVDVVVSNPPYVPVGTEIDRETAEHDPALALWGGADGLGMIREVEAAARRLLKPGGLVVVEHDVKHGTGTQTSAPEVFREWAEVADHRDLTGRDRFVTARWAG